MGGGIALQAALRFPEEMGAAFVLSSFMCDDAKVYETLEPERPSEGRLPKFPRATRLMVLEGAPRKAHWPSERRFYLVLRWF